MPIKGNRVAAWDGMMRAQLVLLHYLLSLDRREDRGDDGELDRDCRQGRGQNFAKTL